MATTDNLTAILYKTGDIRLEQTAVCEPKGDEVSTVEVGYVYSTKIQIVTYG